MGAHAFGQPVLRLEDTRLLRGAGKFLADLVPHDAARAVMLRSPHAHAIIRDVDAAEARAMPGVLAVLNRAEWAADGLGGIPAGARFFSGVAGHAERRCLPPSPAPAAARARPGALRRRYGRDGGGRDGSRRARCRRADRRRL